MDLLTGIASASMDTAREQGQALQQMMESAVPTAGNPHLLDVYA